ncbi:replication associated protein [Exomis microphylla associated virus]|uniref:Replication-associated protein n=1 Tax=Exomis microphylla associated virus TaxID=2093275 RepID=A0A2I8B2L1_9GEMI|nr:replication associated protein [Exomis microphylla associated virus]AUT11878.1 replication associated protein [Exomis microphylla associated virus]
MRIFFRPPTQKSNQLFLTYSYSFKMPRVPNRNRPASSYTAYYRFQKKNAFLTYSQIGGDFKDYIFEKLHTLLLPYEILFLAVSLEHHSPTEEHPEGGFHTHCIFQCNKKLQVNGNLFFNILLPNGKELHPRIDGLNAPKRAMDYITKEDTNPRTMGELRSSGRSPNSVGRSNDEWRRILDASNTKDEFLNNVRESCPTDYVLRWPSILSFANYHYREIVPPYTPRWTEFNGLPDIVKQWAEDNIYFVSESTFNYDLFRPRSLYICGPSRTGKTQWARSLGRHHYMSGQVLDWTNYDVNHTTYHVIDDIRYQKIQTELFKSLIGCNEEYTVWIKHKPNVKIPGGRPCIAITNPDMDWIQCMSDAMRDWFYANCEVYYLSSTEVWFHRQADG